MNKSDLIAFEQEIADAFNAGQIPYPVHLESGNEDELISLFKMVLKNDWYCGTWRGHLKCLLKGVPRETLKEAIFRGESISLCFPEHRVVSSAIVGGIIPIAMGIALGIKRSGGTESVWCFVGDMSALTGDFRAARAYARAHDLPITWVVENNGKSVMTETMDVWGQGEDRFDFIGHDVLTYRYQSSWPHAGAGKRVQF